MGFLTSLMTKELLAKFTWTGKGEAGNKFCFAEFKQIQTILLSAMMKMDVNYSLTQFKIDLQRNLAKCSNEVGKPHTVIFSVDTVSSKPQSVDDSPQVENQTQPIEKVPAN